MRILHIVRNLDVGGMERVVVDLAREQRRTGHEVAVHEVCARSEGGLALPEGVAGFRPERETGRLRRILAVRQTLRTFRPDILHAHNTLALSHGLWGTWGCRKPVVMTKHGMELHNGFAALLHRWPDHIACVSTPVRERLLVRFPSLATRSSVIPNGVPKSEIPAGGRAAWRTTLGIGTGERAFVWVGRVVKEKALDGMLQAFAVLQTDPTWRLFVVGDGPLRTAIEAQAQQAGLTARIVFLGQRTDTREMLAAFDVFLLPSLTEGLPVALLEAASAGLPAIVSKVGGMPDVVCRGNGWVVPPGDVGALAEALRAACRTDEATLKAMGQRSAAVADDLFSVRVCAERYAGIYRRLTDARQPREGEHNSGTSGGASESH